MVQNVPVDQLHSILDAAAEVFRTIINEEHRKTILEQNARLMFACMFSCSNRSVCKSIFGKTLFVLKSFAKQIGQTRTKIWHKVFWTILTWTVTDLQKEGEFNIQLQQGDELKPIPTEMRAECSRA
jgi:type I restriction enzyme, R subunit